MSKLLQKYLPLALFVVIANFIFLAFYQDLLVTINLRTPFLADRLFFDELMKEPFGLMRWVGCWLSQFCYYPIAGTVVYAVIWALSYIIGIKAVGIPSKWSALMMLPFTCLFVGVVGIGYWIYILKDFGYFFSQSVSLLLMLSALCVARKLFAGLKYSSAILLLLCFVLYPLIGWQSVLMALCLLPSELKAKRLKALALLAAFAIPLFYQHTFYTDCSPEMVWGAGFPVFDDQSKFHIRQSVPYILLALIMILLSAFSAVYKPNESIEVVNKKKETYTYYIFTLAVTAIVFGCIWQFMFKDYNYLMEMRMTRGALNSDWQSIISDAQKSKHISRNMVLLKNIALMNTGQLGDRSFELNNDGLDIYNPENLSVRAMHIVSPIVYYNYGKINYSVRWCHENAVVYGYSPFYLMCLAQSLWATGEAKMAKRYTDMLRGNMFFSDWMPQPVTELVKELNAAFANVLDTDSNNCERFVIENFSQSYESQWAAVKELSLFNSLLFGSPNYFWKAFVSYASINPTAVLPLHYQEAYCLFAEEAPVELPFKPRIEENTLNRYVEFRRQFVMLQEAGQSDASIKNSMRKQWGRTYWWHRYFGRNKY